MNHADVSAHLFVIFAAISALIFAEYYFRKPKTKQKK